MKICVLSYPETTGLQRPHSFQLGGRRVAIVAVLDQWEAGGHRYFQVRDLNGRRFVLRHCPEAQCWELEGVYGPASKPVRAAA
jgi:hypothetical protein